MFSIFSHNIIWQRPQCWDKSFGQIWNIVRVGLIQPKEKHDTHTHEIFFKCYIKRVGQQFWKHCGKLWKLLQRPIWQNSTICSALLGVDGSASLSDKKLLFICDLSHEVKNHIIPVPPVPWKSSCQIYCETFQKKTSVHAFINVMSYIVRGCSNISLQMRVWIKWDNLHNVEGYIPHSNTRNVTYVLDEGSFCLKRSFCYIFKKYEYNRNPKF